MDKNEEALRRRWIEENIMTLTDDEWWLVMDYIVGLKNENDRKQEDETCNDE